MPRQVCLYTDDTAIIAMSHQRAAHQLPGVISQQPKNVADKMEDRHQHPKENAVIFANASRHIPTSSAFWGAYPLC
jgi:hypothetical protein